MAFKGSNHHQPFDNGYHHYNDTNFSSINQSEVHYRSRNTINEFSTPENTDPRFNYASAPHEPRLNHASAPYDPRFNHAPAPYDPRFEGDFHHNKSPEVDYHILNTISDENYPPNLETTSAYWSVPDPSRYLTTIATHETENLIAVGSGGRDSNLFLYELQPTVDLNESILTHHQTITLPGIHSLNWVSPFHNLGGENNSNILATGHHNGYINLTLLPDAYSNESAEILKRYDHIKHLKPSRVTSTRIKHFNLTNVNWKSCASSSIISMVSEYVFFWNPSRSETPIIRQRIKGAKCLNASPSRDGIVSLGGTLGVSILDLRIKDSPCLRPKANNNSPSTNVRWSPFDPNIILSTHDDHHIKLWDIRAAGCFADINEHSDVINSVEWSLTTPTEFHSASSDGTVRIWDTNNCDNRNVKTSKTTPPPPPITKEITTVDQSIDELKWLTPAAQLNYKQRKSIHLDTENLAMFNEANSKHRLHSNQTTQTETATNTSGTTTTYNSYENSSDHTTIKSSSKRFLGLAFAPGLHDYSAMLTIDHSGFFGLHARVNPLPESRRYSMISSNGSVNDRRSLSLSSASSMLSDSHTSVGEYTDEETSHITKGVHDFDFS